jgi:hypothetical protein
MLDPAPPFSQARCLHMKDEELSRALSIIRAAARAEGHKPEISNNVETMILFALHYVRRRSDEH